MRRVRTVLQLVGTAAVASSVLASALHSQSSFDNAVRQLNSDNSKGYLQPFADLFASDMSSGWFYSADLTRRGFSFGIELVGAAAKVEDKHRVYSATAPEGFSPQAFQTATVFGGEGGGTTSSGGTEYRGSDGVLDAEYLPSVVPQLRFGISGTEATVRYFSTSVVNTFPEDDFPDVKLLGFGARHSISQYFDNMPVDLTAGIFYSSLTVGTGDEEEIEATYTGLTFGLQASKSFSILTLFAGAASDGGTMNLSYTSTDPDEEGAVDVDLDVKRKIKFSAGASLRLAFLTLFGDASFGPATTYSGGLRLGL
jgi:hypothetical protein